MYVEDLFVAISRRLSVDSFDRLLDEWHRNFIASVHQQIMREKSLSIKQSQMILKLIARLRSPLVRYGMATDDDIDEMLHRPQYRRPLYESPDIRREVRYLGNNILGFRFKQHDVIVSRLRDLHKASVINWGGLQFMTESHLPRPSFNWEHRIWLVQVLHHTLTPILALINEFYFDIDITTMHYLRAAQRSMDQPAIITLSDDGILLATIRDDPLLASWITEVNDGLLL